MGSGRRNTRHVDAGIVQQDIETAEALGGGAHDLRRAVVARDIGNDIENAIAGADFFRGVSGFIERFGIELGRRDTRAGLQQGQGHHAAETASRARDDGDFSVKRSGHDNSYSIVM